MEITNLAADADQFTSNAYLVNSTALIDTGADPIVHDQLENVRVESVVITHTHPDHIANLPQIVEHHDPTVYAFEPGNLDSDAEALADGATVTVANESFHVLYTPGHKPDSICLYNEEEKILFSGDLVFPNGYWGRTDLPHSNHDDLIQSIERVAALEVEALYAGHDTPVQEDADEHITDALRNARNREQPTE